MAFVDEALWPRLSPLLDRALELEGEERERLVRAVTAEDEALGGALARHLAAHDRASGSGFLEASSTRRAVK